MTQTLFIGLDGATFTVLDEMTRDLPDTGVTMPFLKEFMEKGSRSILHSTPNPLTPPAWVSLMTGRTPGHHGIFDFIRAEDKGDDIYFTLYDARHILTETIWSIASRQQKSVIALNFPLTSPPRAASGTCIPGFVPWRHLRRNMSPNTLYDRLKALPNFDPKALAWDFDREQQSVEQLSNQEMADWIEYHLPREQQWFRIAEFLLKEDRPDLMAVMFDGVDKIQHQAWRFLDPALVPSQPNEQEKRIRKLCLTYFSNLDGYIEKLVLAAGPDAQVFFASDHGFTSTDSIFRVNAFLRDKGYLKCKEDDESESTQRRNAAWFANLDWDNTVAYCRTPSSNGITIRIAEKPGDPGLAPENYSRFRDKLIAELRELKDPVTGEAVIRDILKRESAFPGSAMTEAADLTLVLRDYGFVSIKPEPPIVEQRIPSAGTHHPDGIFLSGGKGIHCGKKGASRNIVDIAATLLYSLGLSIPQDFEGQVPNELFTASHLGSHPVTVGAPTLTVESGEVSAASMDEKDKTKIMEQLRMLGYME